LHKNRAQCSFALFCYAGAGSRLGFLEPRRGWLLAVVQATVIWLSYKLIVPTPDNYADSQVEAFGLYGTMILTFVGSFIGGVLKRALDRG
jgi:hypothetical protein